MELNESVLGKLNESFSKGGDYVLRYQRILCVPDVEDLINLMLEEIHGSFYLCIRVPQKCIMTLEMSISGMV